MGHKLKFCSNSLSIRIIHVFRPETLTCMYVDLSYNGTLSYDRLYLVVECVLYLACDLPHRFSMQMGMSSGQSEQGSPIVYGR